MSKKQKGFTLIELLIVIAIIGILASIILVSLSEGRDRANITTYKSQIHSFQAAAILACDSDVDGTLSDGEVALPDSNNKIGSLTFFSSNCGSNGTGEFVINTESLDIGNSLGATACEAADSTIIRETGVTFVGGC